MVLSTPDILKAKNEVADKYLEDLKNELGLFQKGVISLVEDKIKSLLIQEDPIPETIQAIQLTTFEKFLVSLSPKTADKVFNFLKEKQKLILQSTTVQELENLKNGIINTPNTPQNSVMQTPDNTITGGNKPLIDTKNNESGPPVNGNVSGQNNPYIDLGVMGGAGVLEGGQGVLNRGVNAARAEQLGEQLNESGLKNGIDDVLHTLQARIENPELTVKQKKSIQEMIDTFTDASKNTSAIDELKLWKQLVKSNVLSSNIFEKNPINDQAIIELTKLSQNTALMEALANTQNLDEIKTILATNGITSLSDQTLLLLQHAKTSTEVESIVRVLSKSKELSSLAKASRAFPFLDAVIYGMDIYHFWGEEKDARTITHFTINSAIYGTAAVRGITSWGASLAGLSMAGPPGWFVIGGVVVAEGLNYSLDACYFDIKDFYSQEKDDFMKQSRTELKQAIVQATIGSTGTWSNISINENMYNILPGGPGQGEKIKTVENAMRGLLYTEEVNAYPIIRMVDTGKIAYDALSADQKRSYDAEKIKLNATIDTRMKYIKNFLPKGNDYLVFSNAIAQGKSIECIEKIVADSMTYKTMKEDTNIQADNIDDYKKKKRVILEQKNPTLCTKLDEFIKNQPDQVDEFFTNVGLCSMETWYDTDPTSPFYQDDLATKPLVDFAMEYRTWMTLGVPYEQQARIDIRDPKYVSTKEMLKKMSAGEQGKTISQPYDENAMKTFLVDEEDRENRFQESFEYSNDLRQNIIYRIAKEFHGYDGKNDMASLKQYFAEGNVDKKKGLYYEEGGLDNNDGRRMNLDWGVDARLNFLDLEKKTPDELMKEWFGIYILQDGKFFISNTNIGIDGETESADDTINNEFFQKIYTILQEEKVAMSESVQKQTEEEIITYVTDNAQDGYIKLPQYLIMKAGRAGLGNLQYRYFSHANNKISATTTNEYISMPMIIPGVIKQYIDNADGKEKNLSADQIKQLPIKVIGGAEQQAVNSIDNVNKTIQETVGSLARGNERGNILYDPLKKVLRSWSGETIIDSKNGKRIVTGGEMNIQYDSVQEACYTANMINRIRKYKKDHPTMELVYNNLLESLGRGSGLYDVNTGFWNTDTKLLSQGEIDKKFQQTFTGDNAKIFIDYLQHTLI